MPEAYGFPEGQVALWTGAAEPSTSAVIAFAQNTQVTLTRGWMEHLSIDGVYDEHLTGLRVDVSIGAFYTYDATIARMIASATAVHMKFNHSSVNGSAGYFLYSGRVDSLGYNGTEASPYVYNILYHAHSWSGYGG